MIRQKGIALVSVLFVFSLCVVLTTLQINSMRQLTKETELSRGQLSLWGEIASVEDTLDSIFFEENQVFTNNQVVHLDQNWNNINEIETSKNQKIRINILDATAFFNINNLGISNTENNEAENTSQRTFKALLRNQGINDSFEAKVSDWIDSDSDVRSFGAENDFYLSLNPTRIPSNTLLTSLSELYLIDQIEAKSIHTLNTHLIVLEESTFININTAPATVLSALSLSNSVDAIIAKRAEIGGFKSIEAFLLDNATAGLNFPNDLISVTSQYFLVHCEYETNKSIFRVELLVKTDFQTKTTRILKRKQVPYFTKTKPTL